MLDETTWGSVSYPRTHRHIDRGEDGTSNLRITE